MSESSPLPDPTVEAILEAARTDARFGSRARWTAAAALILLGAAAAFLVRARDDAQGPRYETATVSRGNLVVTVSATGTLEPTNQVEVGSELSGLIEAVLVDENDRVAEGQVLARLDVSKLEDQIVKSKAALASAEAKVLQADATSKEARANLERLRAVSELSGGKVPSKAEMETAEATLERAIADAAAARAAVSEARATLSSDETNLAKASIRSPIDGVVLARDIEPGQTVAASFETPVLFTLAEDLSQMELQVDVDEADVGQVEEGQSATFNVDAYPARKYPARIGRVGLGSQTSDGVVSYETILTVENDDLSLRPGMTATAEISTATRENALLVSNGALRFSPPPEGESEGASGNGIVGSLLPRPPAPTKKPEASAAPGDGQRVWVLRDGEAVAMEIRAGVTDGRFTEVVGGELAPGMQVITDLLVSPE
jgi:HlyD family secretion protein